MYLKKIYLCLFIPIQTIVYSQNWTKITDFPSLERDDGSYFIIDHNVFCGTGLKVGYILGKDMYSFDMDTETWDTAASLPNGMERQYASAFSYNNTGFIFAGIAGSNYLNDLWMYDAGTKKWQSKSALPAVGRMGASCFVINDTAYIIGGRTAAASSINEVWAYNMQTDTWTAKNNFPFGSRWRAAGAAINHKGYLIFGKDASNLYRKELYEYDPSTGNWTELSSFPGKGRTYAAMKPIDNNLVIVAGIDSLGISYNDMWRFDLSSMNWKQLASIPAEGRRGGMCFNSNTTIYYTTGISQTNNRLKETWKVFNPTSIHENYLNEQIDVYPNPASGKISIEIKKQGVKINAIEIINTMGQTVTIINKKVLSGSITEVDISSLPNGLYMFNVLCEQGTAIKKILKD